MLHLGLAVSVFPTDGKDQFAPLEEAVGGSPLAVFWCLIFPIRAISGVHL